VLIIYLQAIGSRGDMQGDIFRWHAGQCETLGLHGEGRLLSLWLSSWWVLQLEIWKNPDLITMNRTTTLKLL